jgi:hypothetical protein
MPQQQTPRMRFCSIENVLERAILDFDTTTHGRYHHEVMRMREFMSTMPVAGRNTYSTSTGLHRRGEGEGGNLVVDLHLAPALNLVLSRPSDPARSELGARRQVCIEAGKGKEAPSS